MEHMHLLRATHEYVADSRDHIDLNAVPDTVFQNDIPVMAVNTAQEYDFYLIQLLKILQAFLYLKSLFYIKLILKSVLTDQLLHTFSDIVNDRCLFRRKYSEIPLMCQIAPQHRHHDLTCDRQNPRQQICQSFCQQRDHNIANAICDKCREHLTVYHF